MPRLIHALAVLAALALTAGCTSAPEAGRAPVTGGASKRSGPAAGSPFWVDPRGPAARQVELWRRQGRAGDAALLRRIADEPVALWPAGELDPGPAVRSAIASAA